MNEARFEREDASRPMRVLCHYCGFTSESMVDALRHDACRPRSCERWRELMKATPLRLSSEEIDEALQHMTIQGGGSLEMALDRYLEKIEPVYR